MQNHDRAGPARNTITAWRGVGLVDTAYPTGQTFPVARLRASTSSTVRCL